MSRKREREDDDYLKESNKKAKISKDKKHKKDKKEKKKNKGKQPDLKQEVGSQVFDITELVENILKYLIRRPETVLSIAKVSRRHNAIVHSTSFWTRLGFTEKLSKTHTIEPQALKKLLIGIRRDYIQKKYDAQTANLNLNSQLTKPISQAVDLTFEDQVLLNTGLEHFFAQRTFTSEAYIVLERIRVNSDALSFLDFDEFSEMVLIREAEIKSKEESCEILDDLRVQNLRVQKYPERDDDFEGYYDLLNVKFTHTYEPSFAVRKKYIDENKSVIFFIDFGYYTKIHYISLNEKTNTIECCGDLVLSALDPHNWTEDLQLNALNADVMYDISFFLSRYVFKLSEVKENLADEEFAAMCALYTSMQKRINVSRKVPQYYWENIPLYRK